MATTGTNANGNPPALGELFSRFMKERVIEPAMETAESEVELYQAAGVHVADPRSVLQAATEVATLLLGTSEGSKFQFRTLLGTPFQWASLVRSQTARVAVPLCVGNFPQLVSEIKPLLDGATESIPQFPSRQESLELEISGWGNEMLAGNQLAKAVMAVGMLRLQGAVDAAAGLLGRVKQKAPVAWSPLFQNEEAALAWQRGDKAAALELWRGMASDNTAVQFNLGMAELFAGNKSAAVPHLQAAIKSLPETNSWHHLAQLYLALAQSS